MQKHMRYLAVKRFPKCYDIFCIALLVMLKPYPIILRINDIWGIFILPADKAIQVI